MANEQTNNSTPPKEEKGRSKLQTTWQVAAFFLLPNWHIAVTKLLPNMSGDAKTLADSVGFDFSWKNIFKNINDTIGAACGGIHMPTSRADLADVGKHAAVVMFTCTLLAYLAVTVGYYATWFITSASAQTAADSLSQWTGQELPTDEMTKDMWSALETMKTQQTAIGGLFGIVNSFFLLVFGVIFLAKGLIIPADSASSGKLKISKYWLVRTAVGLALIFPLLTYGLNAGQAIIMNMASVGGSIASMGWKKYATSIVVEGKTFAVPPLPNKYEAVVSNLVLDELCSYLANVVALRNGDEPYVRFTPMEKVQPLSSWVFSQEQLDRLPQDYEVEASYDGTVSGFPKGVCGSITFKIEDHDSGAARTALNAHSTAFKTIIPSASALAKQLGAYFIPGTEEYGKALPDVDETLQKAQIHEQYATALNTQLSSSQELARQELQQAITNQLDNEGWMFAGAYAFRISLAQQVYSDAYGAFPTITGPQPRAIEISDIVQKGVVSVRQWLKNSNYAISTEGRMAGLGTTSFDGLMDNGINLGSLIAFDTFSPDLSSNPMGELSAYGHGIISRVLSTVFVMTGAAGTAGAFDGIPVVGDAAAGAFKGAYNVLGPFLTFFLMILLAAGATLAFVVPFIPYMTYLMGIGMFFIAGMIAMIGIDLAAISMLDHRDQRPFTQGMTAAAMLLLKFIAFPLLMVMGFALAMIFVMVMLNINNELFRDFVFSATEGSGVVGQIAYTVLFTLSSYILVNVGFKLIIRVPNEVFAMIGSATQGLFNDPSDDRANNVFNNKQAQMGGGQMTSPRPGSAPGGGQMGSSSGGPVR